MFFRSRYAIILEYTLKFRRKGGLGLRKFFRGTSLYLLLLIIIIFAVTVLNKDVEPVKEMDVTELVEHLDDDNVKSIISVSDTLKGKLIDGTQFTVILPEEMRYTFYSDYLKDKVDNKEISYGAEAEPTRPWFIEMLPTLFVLLIFGVFWFIFMQQSQGGGNRVMSFGKSRARMHKEEDGEKVTFNDVAGLKEEKVPH